MSPCTGEEQEFSVSTEGRSSMKTHQMFSVHATSEKFETAQSPVILDLCLRKTGAGKSRDYRDVIVFKNAPFSGRVSVYVRPNCKNKAVFSVQIFSA